MSDYFYYTRTGASHIRRPGTYSPVRSYCGLDLTSAYPTTKGVCPTCNTCRHLDLVATTVAKLREN